MRAMKHCLRHKIEFSSCRILSPLFWCLQKRHDIIVFMIQATPAGESAACDAQWREVCKWWDKLAAWESNNG